tara:strand:+ start:3177 stop:3779 length:603 start_codon:yes stop_codon:yes gene_type:complete
MKILVKKIIAIFIGVTFISYGWQYMFDFEGLQKREAEKEVKEGQRKIEKRDELIKSLENMISDVRFEREYCNPNQYKDNRYPYLVICFNHRKDNLPFYEGWTGGEWSAMYKLTTESNYVHKGDLMIKTSTLNNSGDDEYCDGRTKCEYIFTNLFSKRHPTQASKLSMRQILEGNVKSVTIEFYEKNNWDNLLYAQTFTEF